MSKGNGNGVQTRKGLYGFDFIEEDRRRTPVGQTNGRWQIKQLWQRNHEILNLVALGYSHNEVAKIMGVTPLTVSNTVNSELGMHKLSELRRDRDRDTEITVEKIKVLTDKALNVYHEIFDDESGEVSLKDKKATADTVVLELSGLRAPTKIQSQSITTILTAEELEEFKSRGRKAINGEG
jgi:predicted transcriptional regulator